MSEGPHMLRCCDSCGTPPILPSELDLHGWKRLPLTGRVRCLACWRSLDVVNAKIPQTTAKGIRL
jgi:hypothetical protein